MVGAFFRISHLATGCHTNRLFCACCWWTRSCKLLHGTLAIVGHPQAGWFSSHLGNSSFVDTAL